MPASAARIAFVTVNARSYIASDTAVQTRYGTAARDTQDQPVESFFDSMSDVAAMCDERFTLLKAHRRKFQIVATGITQFTGSLDFSQAIPAATVVDSEKVANLACAITSPGPVDYDANKTTFSVWG